MPELPEVEVIRRGLEARLLGHTIDDIQVLNPNLRYPVDVKRLLRSTLHQKIERIDRRSKYLIVHLANQTSIIVHLGMSGRLLILPQQAPFAKHDHVIFVINQALHLRFRDPRRFGLIDVAETNELDSHKYFSCLGPEPFSKDLTGHKFYQRNRKVKRPIKTFLMDARQIVGIGNIYANESLFMAGLRPTLRTSRLTLLNWNRLVAAIRRVLKKAIMHGGTTFSDFQNSEGQPGYYQQSLFVYQREDNPCKRCKTPIRRTVMAGRSTYFCPNCQHC